jgi:hypothetical protein
MSIAALIREELVLVPSAVIRLRIPGHGNNRSGVM